MTKLQVGIIGCGSIAQKRHIPEYVANPKTKIIGFYDRNPKRAQKQTQKYGGKVFNSIKELLNDLTIDAVSICVANFLHATITIDALKAGKHVLCEKPMGLTLDECKQMVQTARKTHKRLLVDQNQRLAPAHKKARALIKQGIIGKPLSFKTTFGHAGPDAWSINKGANTWFFNKQNAGFGVIFDLGIHKIDLIQYLLDDTINSVYTKLATLDKHDSSGKLIPVDDNASAVFTTQKGTLGNLSASWTYYGQEDNSTLIYGSKGIMKIYDDPKYSLKVILKNGEKINYQIGSIQTNNNQTNSGVIDEFVDAVLKSRTSTLDGNLALKSMKTVFSCVKSNAKGQVIKVN